MGNRLVIWLLVLLPWKLAIINSQTISNYVYKFENGVNVVTEKGWNWINLSVSNGILDSAKIKSPLLVEVRSIGDLVAGSKFKVLKDSSEVNMETLTPGSYKLSVGCSLLQKNGTISFDVNDVVIREKMQTILTISVHDAEIIINESITEADGLTIYEVRIDKNTGQNGIIVTPHFYAPGTVSPEIAPVATVSPCLGKIKPGTYDIKTNIELKMTGFAHIIQVKNISLKPDAKYVFSCNLNVGELRYAGDNSNVKAVHLYPAGTASKLKGIAKPQKDIEIFGFERPTWFTVCPPGTYDILLEYTAPVKYEWKRNIVCKVGEQTDIN